MQKYMQTHAVFELKLCLSKKLAPACDTPKPP